jgi:hypothetical protein
MRMILAIVGVLSLCSLPEAHAGFSGRNLYDACNRVKNGNRTDEAACITYIRGFLDGFSLSQVRSQRGFRACPPEKPITPARAELILRKFMVDHPNPLDQPAAIVAIAALATEFACQHP